MTTSTMTFDSNDLREVIQNLVNMTKESNFAGSFLVETTMEVLDKIQVTTDENDIPIVRLPGSLNWETAYKFGQDLGEQFPGQDGDQLSMAMEYNGLGPISETNGIAGLVMEKEGERDSDSWIWLVTCQDGTVWCATGWCDYTGWDCQSGLDWIKVEW